ncbi:MAG: nucleotidyltransferase domain-containing protein [Methanobrevibacter sp.]|jgi:predicted nucleotidyltransferase|nr:nucleotidyltransferase domain-containing protein [Candidatus Methanoflexus mossambicus]
MIQISTDEMEIILKILKSHANDCEVLVFGSRIKGTDNNFSDLDLAFICSGELGLKRIIGLEIAFEESNLPYRVDVVDYNKSSQIFKNIIDNNNQKIFP